MAVHEVTAKNGSEALAKMPDTMIARYSHTMHGGVHRYFVFGTVDDARGHHSTKKETE